MSQEHQRRLVWGYDYHLVGAGVGIVLIIVLLIVLLLNRGNDNAPATIISTLSPIGGYPGGEQVIANAQWTPVVQAFNGVEMVLVPAGCFRMGSDKGVDDEKPVHQQCFETPFWLDRTEVTRTQYETCVAAGGCPVSVENEFSTEPEQPINYLTWLAARDYCTWREPGFTRLPTEREWEYAARGPDNLAYPWGNDFVAEHVVYEANSGLVTQPVGSRPAGASWVGALDMSGNVLEWVSSVYQAYPYSEEAENNSTDDRERRVVRGGAFNAREAVLVRTANRYSFAPQVVYYEGGVRCVRNYQG